MDDEFVARTQQVNDAETMGRRLRVIRRERNSTLADVSARARISVSALSKIENAQISVSYDILKRVCDALDIGIEDIVSSGEKSQLSGRKTTTRANEGELFTSDQYDYRVHSSEISKKAMIPFEMVIRARSVDEFDHWSQHNGEEFVYVLAGAIDIHTEHYTPLRLNQGESAYFDSSMKHLYVSVGDDDARVLSVSYDPSAAEARPVSTYMHPSTR
ncbi:putative transcriptional regulator [Novosphingobium sp. Rr 2-17]|uniref:helix-turn-helix domain-containing protein n=1 Tax=unclassified Novosphingobium TaxID=2644732 RepID=UPI0002699533|nr:MULTISPECIES: XRE family transcriptional regulator [unclassified Novosphingobium]EIZ79202.1 putative transcriptional regulator [Novosphingobium sp. Rr 2-17]SFF79086.1 transcriptional regulator, XRE family with cupin sensor [Novosphingobium sp. CF614]